jgi:hypothetical protein
MTSQDLIDMMVAQIEAAVEAGDSEKADALIGLLDSMPSDVREAVAAAVE